MCTHNEYCSFRSKLKKEKDKSLFVVWDRDNGHYRKVDYAYILY